MTDTLIAKTIRPYIGHGRAALSESPVDEVQTSSGLIRPLSFDGDDAVRRGVVLSCVIDPLAIFREIEPLEVGAAVWYRSGIRIADVVIVDLQNVLAYEADA